MPLPPARSPDTPAGAEAPDHPEPTQEAHGDVLRAAIDVRGQIIARARAELMDWCLRLRAGRSAPEAGDETILSLAEEIGLVRRTLDLAGDAGAAARVERLLADLGLAEPEDDEAAVRLAKETASGLAAGDWRLLMKGQRF